MVPKLLVIDDDELMAQLVLSIGKDVGFTVQAVAGVQAESAYMRFKPDLIVLDILMPTVDGFEIIKLLKDAGSTSRVVLLSGDDHYRTMAENIAGGLKLMANLAKPFDIVAVHRLLTAQHQQLLEECKISAA